MKEVLPSQLLQKTKCTFVFDIDSTLYNVSPRNKAIIQSYSKTITETKPNIAEALKLTIVEPFDWGVKAPIVRQLKKMNLSLTQEEIESLQSEVFNYWKQTFFGKDFLHFDEEYPGAVDFLNELAKNNTIYYLTGRDIPRMGEGTLQQLKNSNFPLESQKFLICKPCKTMVDQDYKNQELKKLSNIADQGANEIIFLDNEAIIINEVMKNNPSVYPIFVDSVHSGREEINPLSHFIKPNFIG